MIGEVKMISRHVVTSQLRSSRSYPHDLRSGRSSGALAR